MAKTHFQNLCIAFLMTITLANAGVLTERPGTEPTETSSGDIPRSDPAWLETNIVTGDDDDLVAMVTELQLQMKEQRVTYARQRSNLHMLQEKVARQETEFGKLKQHISELKTQQGTNMADLKMLKKAKEDYSWGITDLKQAQQRFREDVLVLKKEQKITNSSLEQYMDLIEGTYETQGLRVDEFEQKIYKMDSHLRQVTDSIHQGKLNFTGLEVTVNNIKQGIGADYNKIKIMENEESKEGSGDIEAWDSIASTVEENSNTIGDAMNHITKTEEKMTQHVDTIDHKMSSHSVQILDLNNTINNLADKITNLGNSVSLDRTSWGKVLETIEENILNLSQQLYAILEWQKNTDMAMKITEENVQENKEDISRTRESTITHSGRMRYIQKIFSDMQTLFEEKYQHMTNKMKSLSNNVTLSSSQLRTHVRRASSALKSSVFKLEDLMPKVSRMNDRLAHVEVKVLNASLQECKGENNNLIQDLRIKNLESEYRNVKYATDSQNRKFSSYNNELAKIYNQIDSDSVTLRMLAEASENVTNLIPSFQRAQSEVVKFVTFLPKDCTQISNEGNPATGTYLIRPVSSLQSLPILCDMTTDNTAWTVIQKRTNGEVSFAQTWDQYSKGFGSVHGEYWIGNDNLHYLTNQANYSIRIEMWDMAGKLWIAEYDNFRIGNASSKYVLSISGYRGNATDSLSYSNNMAFSTADMDNDASSTHCAQFYTSGWWYKHCHYANMNGRADIGIVWFNHEQDEWMQMKRSEMKISRWED